MNPLTPDEIQTIVDKCYRGGFNTELALRTAERDGIPWYRRETPTQEFERQLAESRRAA